jgi:NADH-quinone oxidoreductase subunit M
MDNILSLMTFVPLLGMLVILFLPGNNKRLVQMTAVLFTAIPLVLAFVLYGQFDRNHPGMQFVERTKWIPAFNIDYFVGVDGLSITMVLLTALLSFICVFASFSIEKHLKAYFALFLLLETGMMGVFVALDFFLFYVFWEVMLLPMYFLIGVWGGPRREYAAIKFFLYTLFGSVLMLLAMLALYFANGRSFDMMQMIANNAAYTRTFQIVSFLALFIGFAIKVPVFPFHTWLPDAHVEAPTAISVILAGVLLKMGIYGIFRISYPMFPQATLWFAPWMAVLGLVNIVYGALCAMAQKDMKKLVAYSSVSHMGYCLLGMAAMNPQGFSGSVLQMFNHGTITAMLFLIVGVIYDRAHHRDIDGFGGLFAQMPRYTALVSIAFFAALGLPGLSGFISEALVFIGAFPVFKMITIISVSGVVLTAAYMLWLTQRVFLGQLNPKYATMADVTPREVFTLVPLALIVIWVGVYPMPILNLITSSLTNLVGQIR